MATGTRVRDLVVALPVVTALAVLAVVGVFAPRLIDPGLHPAALIAGVLVAGIGSVGLLLHAALRGHPRLRLSWAAAAVAAALWTGWLLAELAHWHPLLGWIALRIPAFVAVGIALLAAPGAQRSPREWGLLLMDGWLVGGSVFLIGWVALTATGSPFHRTGTDLATLYWLPFDLMVASTTAGLAARTEGWMRGMSVGLLVIASLLTVTGDTTLALTRTLQFGVVEWIIMLAALGLATLPRQAEPPSRAVRRHPALPARPQFTRLAQLAVMPGLLAAAMPGRDTITCWVAASVIAVLAIEMLLLTRQHAALWRTLELQADRLDQLVRESRDAIVQLDRAGEVEFANDAVADVLGYGPRSLVGRNGLSLIHPNDRAEVLGELARLDGGGLTGIRVGARFQHSDGSWRFLESTASRRGGGAGGYTLSMRDMSERNRLEAELRRLASTDALTGLLNRQAFLTLLEERLPRGDTAVLFLDLDGFKAVNDSAGHAAGDRLLREVADALRDELRAGDIAARLGGDEFAVLPAVRRLDEASALASRLVQRLRYPSAWEGHVAWAPALVGSRHRVGVSIGVAIDRQVSAEHLLVQADRAMYLAKAAGGGFRVIRRDQGGTEDATEPAGPAAAAGVPARSHSARSSHRSPAAPGRRRDEI